MRDTHRKAGHGHAFERDCLETSVLRGAQSDVQDQQDRILWKKLPDAKVPARDKSNDDTILKVLVSVDLTTLHDLVPLADIVSMRSDAEPMPGDRDRSLHAKLHNSLKDLSRNPDIQTSYQYLSGKNTVVDEKNNDIWQVQLSRRRRKILERMSREHHQQDDEASEPVHDEHGNEIVPMIEATKKVATMKDIKRIKRRTASRRRAGLEVYTDDEMEAANLEMPPPDAAPKVKPAAATRAPANKAVGSPTGGYVKLVSKGTARGATADDMRESMGAMYLEPNPVASPASESTDSTGSWMLIGGHASFIRVASGSSC